MVSQEELSKLYNSDLKDKLSSLEEIRKTILILNIITVVLLIGTIMLIILLQIRNPYIAIPMLIVLFLLALYPNAVASKKKIVYRAAYKKEVVLKVVNLIDPSWSYSANNCIPQSEYRASGIFTRKLDKYEGDDLIVGKIENTDFCCSELHTSFKTSSTDSDGTRKERYETIFKGLFFHADFNKLLQGQTYILPDYTEKFFGKSAQAQSKKKMGESVTLVQLENAEFEKSFKVYTTNQVEARYILTPKIMEALVNIRKTYKRPMHLSFLGTKVYCAIKFKKDLFEPRVTRSGVKFSDIELMYHLFKLNTCIIHELNLNTRIWTKH